MNVQEKFKIIIVQMSLSPELHTCESEELKQEKRDDVLHEIITPYENNIINARFRRKPRAKNGVTCCWFDQKPSNTQLNNLYEHPPFI